MSTTNNPVLYFNKDTMKKKGERSSKIYEQRTLTSKMALEQTKIVSKTSTLQKISYRSNCLWEQPPCNNSGMGLQGSSGWDVIDPEMVLFPCFCFVSQHVIVTDCVYCSHRAQSISPLVWCWCWWDCCYPTGEQQPAPGCQKLLFSFLVYTLKWILIFCGLRFIF